MPHFDENGYGTWICQSCGRIYNDLIRSVWATPVPGKGFSGNVCPTCVEKYKRAGIEVKTEAPKTIRALRLEVSEC